jgi:hypothetical protein
MSFAAGSVTYSSRFPNTTIPHAGPLAWATCPDIGSNPPRLEQASRQQFAHLFALIPATSSNDSWLTQRTAFDDWQELMIRLRGWVPLGRRRLSPISRSTIIRLLVPLGDESVIYATSALATAHVAISSSRGLPRA